MTPRQDTAPSALTLLPLDIEGLSEQQRRGIICVYDGIALDTTAVDLGQRPHGQIQVFPRACPRCVADQAAETAGAHAAICESCVDTPAGCETVAALRRLHMEHAR
jgi:hypothetical protein